MKARERCGKKRIFRGLTCFFAALMILSGSLRTIAFNWADKVNELLGISFEGVERSMDPKEYRYPSDFASAEELVDAEIGIATRIQAEGTVLLKGTAKVDGMNVTLFGMRSHLMQYGGTMGGRIADTQCVGLADALSAAGFNVNPVMRQFYKDREADYRPGKASGAANVSVNNGASVNEVPVSEYTRTQEDSYETYKDAAIVVLGRDSSEGSDYYPGTEGLSSSQEFSGSPTGNILGLSDDERDLISYVTERGFGKVIVLVNSGSAMELEELERNKDVHTILWIGNPGCYGTYGIAQILSGEVIPSGHLADTYAVNSALSPAAVNFGAYTFANADQIDSDINALRAKWYLTECEGIYTGYKYYETRYYDSITGKGNASAAMHGEAVNGSDTWDYEKEVTYPFGYGLEGSEFTEEITEVKVDWSGEKDSTIAIHVTNTGEAAAKHVVQLYVSQPYTEYDRGNGVEKSAIQLVGYAKTGENAEQDYRRTVLLAPGESEEVIIAFNISDFRTYDAAYMHDDVTGAYIMEAGEYVFATGNGAHDAVQSVLKYQYPELMRHIYPTGATRAVQLDKDKVFTESNGTLVQNCLDGADLNRWNCGTDVQYLTRNDWAGTFPKTIDTVAATEEMIRLLNNITYDPEKANAEYHGKTSWEYDRDPGLSAMQLAGLDYDDPLYEELMKAVSLSDMLDQYTANEETLGSIGLPRVNGADSPLGIIGVLGKMTKGTIYELEESDSYYGHQTNVYGSEVVVASTYSHLLASEQGRMIGNDSIWTLITQWNAPGLNLHRTPYNARNYEYYSEDPVLTGTMGADLVTAVQRYGVQATAKHFAFNDQETNRDGLAVFIDEQAARENELRGFQIVIEKGKLMNLMSAFNRVGLTHCGADRGLMNGILRGEWGYNGRLLTDSVKSAQYFRPSECLMAGNDQMLGGGNSLKAWEYSVQVFENDPVLQHQLREAYHRYLYAAINSNRMNGITKESTVTSAYTSWQWGVTIAWGGLIALTAVSAVLWMLHSGHKCLSDDREGEKRRLK